MPRVETLPDQGRAPSFSIFWPGEAVINDIPVSAVELRRIVALHELMRKHAGTARCCVVVQILDSLFTERPEYDGNAA